MERETGIEPATSGLGSLRSTAELLPRRRRSYLSPVLAEANQTIRPAQNSTAQRISAPHGVRCDGVGRSLATPSSPTPIAIPSSTYANRLLLSGFLSRSR